MTPRASADRKLRRLLHVLPAAAREGGVRLSELADELDVSRDRIVRDIEEATARAFYQRPGRADRLQIALESDRVSVWTAGEFRRPVKLTPREALALHLALRGHPGGGSGGDGRDRNRELARRLERDLAVEPSEGAERIAAEGQAAGDRTRRVRSALFRAARLGRLCRVRYLSSGAASPSGRVLAPYAMVYSDGRWYALAGTGAQGGGEVRIFRGDRVLDAEVLDEGFEVPDDFDPADHLTEGAPYDPHEPVEARVRYSPRIARWIREKGPVEEREDGSVVVTHSVSDRDWLVRHVLRYGADAEVLGPAELRRLVAREARRVASAGRGSRGIGSEGRSN